MRFRDFTLMLCVVTDVNYFVSKDDIYSANTLHKWPTYSSRTFDFLNLNFVPHSSMLLKDTKYSLKLFKPNIIKRLLKILKIT